MNVRSFSITVEDATLVGERREGEGMPLVLIHGFGGSRRDWDGVVAALPADLPLIAYDQRGFGESIAEPQAPYSYTEDLAALLDALDLPRADLCGLSLGGATALNFTLDQPQRVGRLVLVSPLMAGWSWTEDWIERWKQIGRAARAGDIVAARDLWWRHPLFETTRAGPGAGQLRAAIDGFHGRQWAEDHQKPALPDIDRLTGLAAPTLLLTGAHDTADFRLIADLVAGAGQQVTRIDHADAGHLLNLEIPDVLGGEIARFVARAG